MMTLAQALAALDAHGRLVDIGQLERGVTAALRRMVKRGELVAFIDYGFPIPKRGYARPSLTPLIGEISVTHNV